MEDLFIFFHFMKINLQSQPRMQVINVRSQSRRTNFLSLEVNDKLVKFLLQIMIISKIKSIHDRLRDDDLYEIVEIRIKIIGP